MVFLRREGEERHPRLHGRGVFLRTPEWRDYEAWAALRGESRAFLQPWEPAWPADELSRPSFRYKLKRYAEDLRTNRGRTLFVFRSGDETLVGGISISRMQRGVAQSCAIGYWAGERFTGLGHMSAAVRVALRHCFDDLAMHRVEAACQPENAPSRRLLERVGFTLEGRARSYLKIDGEWRDHLLFAIVAGDPTP